MEKKEAFRLALSKGFIQIFPAKGVIFWFPQVYLYDSDGDIVHFSENNVDIASKLYPALKKIGDILSTESSEEILNLGNRLILRLGNKICITNPDFSEIIEKKEQEYLRTHLRDPLEEDSKEFTIKFNEFFNQYFHTLDIEELSPTVIIDSENASNIIRIIDSN